MPDEIIEELWRIKDGMAREHGHDVRKLAAYLQNDRRAEDERTARLSAVDDMPAPDEPVEPADKGLA